MLMQCASAGPARFVLSSATMPPTRVTPNQITALSLLASLGTGVAAALGHLITALWLFTASGVLDILDGREDLDLDRVGAAGVSLGGYHAPRAAAFWATA